MMLFLSRIQLYRTKSTRRILHEAGTKIENVAEFFQKNGTKYGGPAPEPLTNYLDVS